MCAFLVKRTLASLPIGAFVSSPRVPDLVGEIV